MGWIFKGLSDFVRMNGIVNLHFHRHTFMSNYYVVVLNY